MQKLKYVIVTKGISLLVTEAIFFTPPYYSYAEQEMQKLFQLKFWVYHKVRKNF